MPRISSRALQSWTDASSLPHHTIKSSAIATVPGGVTGSGFWHLDIRGHHVRYRHQIHPRSPANGAVHSIHLNNAHHLERAQLAIVLADRDIFTGLEDVLVEAVTALIGVPGAMNVIMEGP